MEVYEDVIDPKSFDGVEEGDVLAINLYAQLLLDSFRDVFCGYRTKELRASSCRFPNEANGLPGEGLRHFLGGFPGPGGEFCTFGDPSLQLLEGTGGCEDRKPSGKQEVPRKTRGNVYHLPLLAEFRDGLREYDFHGYFSSLFSALHA
jgi:hypothetical protein